MISRTLYMFFLVVLLGLIFNSFASAASLRNDYSTAQEKGNEIPDHNMYSPEFGSGGKLKGDISYTDQGDTGKNNSTAFSRNLATEAAAAGGGVGSLILLICICCCLIGYCCDTDDAVAVSSSEERRPIIIVA